MQKNYDIDNHRDYKSIYRRIFKLIININFFRRAFKLLFTKWYGIHSLYYKFISIPKSIPFRNKLAFYVAKTLPKVSSNLKSSVSCDLEKKGYYIFQPLSSDIFKSTCDFLLSAPVAVGQSSELGHVPVAPLKDFLNRGTKENLFHIPLDYLTSFNNLLYLANDPQILLAAGSYLGCKPTLFNIIAWWSEPNATMPKGAQNFHRDYDDLKFIKYFIYITDVDMQSGPHVYVEGSHISSKLNLIRRFSNNEVKEKFPDNNQILFTGNRGTRFIEDTRGIHKGLLPKRNRRLMLQFVYVLVPIGAYPLPKSKFNNIEKGKIDEYVSRLYI